MAEGMPDNLKGALDASNEERMNWPKPKGEQPFRNPDEAERAKDNWKKYRNGTSAENAAEMLKKPKIAEGSVNKNPFSREVKSLPWLKNIQKDFNKLLSYIGNPLIKVESNFSNFASADYMKSFLALVIDFTKIEKDSGLPTTLEKFEEMAKKRGLNSNDIWGPQGILNLAYAVRRSSHEETSKTNVVRLTLRNAGNNYHSLECDDKYVIRHSSPPILPHYGRIQARMETAPPLTSSARPVPDALVEDEGEMGKIIKDFEGMTINGHSVEVRIFKEIKPAKGPTVYKGIIASHTQGGGHNDFEVRRDGKAPNLRWIGNTRSKLIVAMSPKEFIASVLNVNLLKDDLTAKNQEEYFKGMPLSPDNSGYADATPEEVKPAVEYMRNNPRDLSDLHFACKQNVVNTKDQYYHALAFLVGKGKITEEKAEEEKRNCDYWLNWGDAPKAVAKSHTIRLQRPEEEDEDNVYGSIDVSEEARDDGTVRDITQAQMGKMPKFPEGHVGVLTPEGYAAGSVEKKPPVEESYDVKGISLVKKQGAGGKDELELRLKVDPAALKLAQNEPKKAKGGHGSVHGYGKFDQEEE